MDADPLDDLRRLVVDDSVLRDRLLAAPERHAFIVAVIEMAQAHGIVLSADQVVEGLRVARLRRREQWV